MSIDLNPQTVAMIEKKMQTGQFESVDELLQVALKNVLDDEGLDDEEIHGNLECLNRGLTDIKAGRVCSRSEFEQKLSDIICE